MQTDKYIICVCTLNNKDEYFYYSKDNFESDNFHIVVANQSYPYIGATARGNSIVITAVEFDTSLVILYRGTIGSVLTESKTKYKTTEGTQTYKPNIVKINKSENRCFVGTCVKYFVFNLLDGNIIEERWNTKDNIYNVDDRILYSSSCSYIEGDDLYLPSCIDLSNNIWGIIKLENFEIANHGFIYFKKLDIFEIYTHYFMKSDSSIFLLFLGDSKYNMFGYFSNIAIPNIQFNNAFAYIRVKIS